MNSNNQFYQSKKSKTPQILLILLGVILLGVGSFVIYKWRNNKQIAQELDEKKKEMNRLIEQKNALPKIPTTSVLEDKVWAQLSNGQIDRATARQRLTDKIVLALQHDVYELKIVILSSEIQLLEKPKNNKIQLWHNKQEITIDEWTRVAVGLKEKLHKRENSLKNPLSYLFEMQPNLKNVLQETTEDEDSDEEE
ncbi:hypothetical protein [Candidatus Phytoplasma pruni]|uniref:Uncharacterized protein n=1 Tax=Candidatus Phytoplasma pruni TaxID=479893 RepID=A0A851HBQ8_9MOLU|nr:hypothetical protein [Candidatus Phytoplasma pruni]NWN45515.1 hypothetical protein [Candidatus Phytoplasma pruni]